MKRYMLSILPLFLTLCLMAGCGGRSAMHSRLAAVDSIVDSRYDSALTVLREMDTLQMRRSDRMYLELLRAKAMNKASVPFTSDSVMRRVARYYDRHGSPNQRLLAHYLLGCVYRDLRSAPRALEEYQRAVSQADTTRADCDLPTLMRVYSQMSKLYMMMRLTDESLQMGRKAQKVCYLMGDSLTALIFEEKYCFALCNDGKYRECIEATQKLYDYYMDRRMEDDAALVCIYFAQAYNGLGDFPQARHYLDMYERNSYLRTDPRKIAGGLSPYYICRGNCFLGLGMPDSAEVSFRKVTKDMHNMQNESTIYNGLLRTFILKRETDSICKYADLANDCIMQDFNASTAEDAIHVRSIYDYGMEQKIANEVSRKNSSLASKLYILTISLLVSGILVIVFFFRNERNKRMMSDYRQRLQSKLYELHQTQERIKQIEAACSDGESNPLFQKVEKLQQEILELNSQMEKLTRAKSSMSLSSTSVVTRFHDMAATRGKEQPTFDDWCDLKKTIENHYPSFGITLKENTQIDEVEYRVCLLVKVGMRPSEINTLLKWNNDYASTVRKRLCEKIFHQKGSASDFDQKIKNMY